VITFRVGLSPSLAKTASSTRVAYQQSLVRIRHIPGIQAVDFTNIVPLRFAWTFGPPIGLKIGEFRWSEQDSGGPFWVGPQESTSIQDATHALYFETGPEYLQTMKIPPHRSRFFTPADTSESEPVIVIDSILAHTYFPDKDPVGQIITIAHWRTARVIGVVGTCDTGG
jgi:MacB-like periplasmic core domain